MSETSTSHEEPSQEATIGVALGISLAGRFGIIFDGLYWLTLLVVMSLHRHLSMESLQLIEGLGMTAAALLPTVIFIGLYRLLRNRDSEMRNLLCWGVNFRIRWCSAFLAVFFTFLYASDLQARSQLGELFHSLSIVYFVAVIATYVPSFALTILGHRSRNSKPTISESDTR